MSTVTTQNFKDLATSKSIDASYVTDGTAKAWLNGTIAAALTDSFNISSGTDNGTGDYSYDLTNSMSDANYIINATANDAGAAVLATGEATDSGTLEINTFNTSASANDRSHFASVFGDLA